MRAKNVGRVAVQAASALIIATLRLRSVKTTSVLRMLIRSAAGENATIMVALTVVIAQAMTNVRTTSAFARGVVPARNVATTDAV